jgi:hypothetical protein
VQDTMADAQILSNGRNEMTNGCNGHVKENLDRATEVDDVSIEYFFPAIQQLFMPKFSVQNSCLLASYSSLTSRLALDFCKISYHPIHRSCGSRRQPLSRR